jgi:hypothetical protein
MARDEIDPAGVRDLRSILHEKRRIRDLRKLTDAPRTRCPARVADGAGLPTALAPPGAHSPSTYLVVSPLLPSDPTKFCLERFRRHP